MNLNMQIKLQPNVIENNIYFYHLDAKLWTCCLRSLISCVRTWYWPRYGTPLQWEWRCWQTTIGKDKVVRSVERATINFSIVRVFFYLRLPVHRNCFAYLVTQHRKAAVFLFFRFVGRTGFVWSILLPLAYESWETKPKNKLNEQKVKKTMNAAFAQFTISIIASFQSDCDEPVSIETIDISMLTTVFMPSKLTWQWVGGADKCIAC